VHPIGIDLGSCDRESGIRRIDASQHRKRQREHRCRLRWAAERVFGLLPQSGRFGGQAGSSVQHLDPRSVTASVAPLRLLIVSTQVTVFCLRFLLTGVRI
jgi:hypothetical protein